MNHQPAWQHIQSLFLQQNFLTPATATSDTSGDNLLSYLRPLDNIPIAEGLAIYRQAHENHVKRTLREQYPALHRVLGMEASLSLLTDFLVSYCPRSYHENSVRQDFLVFLQQSSSPLSTDFLRDLAKLEDAIAEVAFAAAPTRAMPRFSFIQGPHAIKNNGVWRLNPWITLCRFSHNISDVYETCRNHGLAKAHIERQSHCLAIYRHQGDVFCMTLPLQAYEFLRKMQQDLERATTNMVAIASDDQIESGTLERYIAVWCQAGILVSDITPD